MSGTTYQVAHIKVDEALWKKLAEWADKYELTLESTEELNNILMDHSFLRVVGGEQ